MVFGCGNNCIKFLVFTFNALICLVGAILMGVSLWANLSPGFMDELQKALDNQDAGSNVSLSTYTTAIWVLVAIGAFVFLVGFLGCCGAACENRLLLGLFIIIITILFVAELATGIFALVKKNDFKDELHKALQEANKPQDDWLKPVEDQLECCGLDKKRDGCKYPDGGACWPKIWSQLEDGAVIAGGVAIGLLIIEALAIIFACVLCGAIGRTSYRY